MQPDAPALSTKIKQERIITRLPLIERIDRFRRGGYSNSQGNVTS